MSSALFAPIEKALVKFQTMLSKVSMSQQDSVERLATKTGTIYDKMRTNALAGGVIRGALQVAGASFNLVGTLSKASGLNDIPRATSDANKNLLVKQVEADADAWIAGGRACEAVAGIVSPYFDAQRMGYEKNKELTQIQLGQQTSFRSTMTNIEQYSNTLEQRVDSQKQSARQV